MIPKRELGRTGWQVTQLGYGSMGLRGPRTWGVRVVEEEQAETILHAVLDCGINFIDTAPDYGLSEERIGRYLSSRRKEFYLATKCGCDPIQQEDHLDVRHTWTKEVVQRNIEQSLERLRTDHIDLLQFHGGDMQTLRDNGLIELLQDYQAQGIVGHLGMSNKMPALSDCVRGESFATFQVPYSCLAPEHDNMLQQAADRGAGIILRGGIAHGGPDAEIRRPVLEQVWEQARLDELLTPGTTRAELILRYTLSRPYCHTTIVGTCNVEHLKANVRACIAGPLEKSLQAEIHQRVQHALA